MLHPLWEFWSEIALGTDHQAHIFGFFVLIPLSRIPQHILKELVEHYFQESLQMKLGYLLDVGFFQFRF